MSDQLLTVAQRWLLGSEPVGGRSPLLSLSLWLPGSSPAWYLLPPRGRRVVEGPALRIPNVRNKACPSDWDPEAPGGLRRPQVSVRE